MFKGDHRDKAARQRSLKEETQKAKAGFYACALSHSAQSTPGPGSAGQWADQSVDVALRHL